MRALLLSLLLPLAARAADGESTVLFVGGSAGDGTTPTLKALRERLAAADPERTVVVFTGNYMKGELPEKEDEGREAAEAAVLAHVDAVRDFFARGGRVYFLPGHTDFAAGGTRAVKRLRKLLNRSFTKGGDDGLDVMPEAMCANSTYVKLGDSAGLLLVNSQWWMQANDEDPDFGDTCIEKTQKAFLGNVSDQLRAHRSKRLIIASHHPLGSYGELGGSFTANAHAQPFPVAGTAWVLARQVGLVPQYHNHPLVQSYVHMVVGEARRYGTFVFASGHDPSLQYVTVAKQAQIISGTSANSAGPVVQASTGDFSAAVPGWAEVAIGARGGDQVRFIAQGAQTLFAAKLPEVNALPQAEREVPAPMPQGRVLATYSKHDVWKLPGAVRFFTGSFYADAFGLKLPYEVLDLERAGLTPYKLGGGQQSNSIRAHDADGGDWAIRSTTKDSTRLLPYPLNRLSLVTRGLEHAFTATHPEAAVAVPRLADAAGVLTVRPKLMFLPDQAALGGYRGFISDEVVLVEQRPANPKHGVTPPAYLGGVDEKTKYEAYDDLVEKLLDKPGKHRVDQEAMLRARLLDVLIGDWDRHRGQWRFAGNEDGGGVKVWTPIAMDRDQAFAHYDGVVLKLGWLMVPQSRSLQPFDGSYGPLRWLNYNARDVDALMLNRLGHQRWMELAREVKAGITDPVIDEALATWHEEAYALDGARIAQALKLRRDSLLEVAEEMYRRQARNVDVLGSNGDDRFELAFGDDGTVRVTVGAREGGGEPWFDRTVQPGETDEVRLYALDGDDLLEVRGRPHHRISLRFVGGEGKDVVTAERGATLKVHALAVYDRVKGARIDPSIDVSDERSELARLNQYEQRENHEPDQGGFMPGLLVNPDQGVYLGGTYTHLVPGYKKEPFAARHSGSAYFATATLGASLDYRGLFPNSVEVFDQLVELTVHTPQYTRDFYGFTNRYHGDELAKDYWRVRQALYEARYGLAYGFGSDRSRVGAQLLGQGIVTERTPGRYVDVAPQLGPDAFGARWFFGGRLFAETNTFDRPMLPTRGIALHASVEGRWDARQAGGFSSNHKLAAAAAVPLDRNQRFVLISRASIEGILGPHPFYFAPTLGTSQLRAYHPQQLAGDLAFAHTTDLRIDLLRIHWGLPGTIGINVSADHGRVWGAQVAGDDYHFNYGGGVWWSIGHLFGVQLSYHRGLDGGQRFAAAVGPLFADTGF